MHISSVPSSKIKKNSYGDIIFFSVVAMLVRIPVRLPCEAERHVIALETTAGEVFRGKLLEARDKHRDSQYSLEGAQLIQFFILLKSVPMLPGNKESCGFPFWPAEMGKECALGCKHCMQAKEWHMFQHSLKHTVWGGVSLAPYALFG